MRDEGAAEGAGRVRRPVLGDGAETRLAENVAAGLTAVWAEVDVEAHSAGEALSVLLLLAVPRQTAGFLSLRHTNAQVHVLCLIKEPFVLTEAGKHLHHAGHPLNQA